MSDTTSPIDPKVLNCIIDNNLRKITVSTINALIDIKTQEQGMRHKIIRRSLQRLSEAGQIQECGIDTWRMTRQQRQEQREPMDSEPQQPGLNHERTALPAGLNPGTKITTIWLALASADVSLGLGDLQKITGMDKGNISPHLSELKRMNLARRIGDGPVGRWALADEVQPAPEPQIPEEVLQELSPAGRAEAEQEMRKEVPVNDQENASVPDTEAAPDEPAWVVIPDLEAADRRPVQTDPVPDVETDTVIDPPGACALDALDEIDAVMAFPRLERHQDALLLLDGIASRLDERTAHHAASELARVANYLRLIHGESV